MSRASLEDRVVALEKQVALLLSNHSATRTAKDWRHTRGSFTGDDLMKQIFAEEGAKSVKRKGNEPSLDLEESDLPSHDPVRHRSSIRFSR